MLKCALRIAPQFLGEANGRIMTATTGSEPLLLIDGKLLSTTMDPIGRSTFRGSKTLAPKWLSARKAHRQLFSLAPTIETRLCGVIFGIALIALLISSGRAADWKPAAGPLMTRWAKDVSPTNVRL